MSNSDDLMNKSYDIILFKKIEWTSENQIEFQKLEMIYWTAYSLSRDFAMINIILLDFNEFSCKLYCLF